MNETDFKNLDGSLLTTFLILLEESSVTRTAERLNLTQSAVSHALNRLRRILGDPLFVRSGQGLTATETALSLKGPVKQILDDMKALTHSRAFDPQEEAMHFIIAANDLQRDLIFPALLRDVRASGIDLSLEFIPSGVPSVGLLRDAKCQLLLTPLPPDARDLRQQRIMTGEMVCFFDGRMREAPKTWDDYLAADHIAVRFADGGTSGAVIQGADMSQLPRPVVTVANFSGVPNFVLGTTLVATEVDLMRLNTFKGLDHAALPHPVDPIGIYLVWHERSTNDPAHIWLRQEIRERATALTQSLAAGRNAEPGSGQSVA